MIMDDKIFAYNDVNLYYYIYMNYTDKDGYYFGKNSNRQL